MKRGIKVKLTGFPNSHWFLFICEQRSTMSWYFLCHLQWDKCVSLSKHPGIKPLWLVGDNNMVRVVCSLQERRQVLICPRESLVLVCHQAVQTSWCHVNRSSWTNIALKAKHNAYNILLQFLKERKQYLWVFLTWLVESELRVLYSVKNPQKNREQLASITYHRVLEQSLNSLLTGIPSNLRQYKTIELFNDWLRQCRRWL